MTLSEDLFAKFKKILSRGAGAKQQFLALCKERYGLILNDGEVEVRDSVLWVKSTSAVKNKLFTLRSALLQELQKQNIAIHDIRF